MADEAVPTNPGFMSEWLARELGEVLTDKREPVQIVMNRAERRKEERRRRLARNKM
jgi:hypothetical protein